MPIPKFDLNSVLPPHLGDPRNRKDLSPYPCTSLEFCDRFATSKERIEILSGWLNLRERLIKEGMVMGFQWIDGSFLEDIESTEHRSPRDVDVVTFYREPSQGFSARLLATFPDLGNGAKIKADYKVDHFPVDMGYSPESTVELTRYWYGLFSHTRTGVWKGMLRIDLNTPIDDTKARNLLAKKP